MGEFWAAIAGAVLGGLIAFFVQMYAVRAAKEQRDEERDQARKALGHSLLFKMIKIHSNLHSLHSHLEEELYKAVQHNPPLEPWQVVLPLANLPERINFSADEMAMLLSLKDDETFNAVVSMDAIHNSLIDLFVTHRDRRYALADKLPAEMEGAVGSSDLTREQMLMLRPKMVELNLLIDAMRVRATLDVNEAAAVRDQLNATLTSKLGMAIKLHPKAVAIPVDGDTAKGANA